jgi:hypothetical protein
MLQQNAALTLDDVKKQILEFCQEPHAPVDILAHIWVEVTPDNHSKYIKRLIDQRFITSAYLRKRSAANQMYCITQKGLNYLKAIA